MTTPSISPKRSDRPRIAIAAVLSVVALLLAAVPVANSQSIWSDETTQMVGLRLNPFEAARWLMGEDPARFGVPADRMPPLSYWAGWGWSRTFGLTEDAMRAMSLFATACATVAVAVAAGRLGGHRSAWVGGFLFALSPNIVAIAGEIRAYPLLLAASGFVFLSLVGYVQSVRKVEHRWLLAIFVMSLLASYTHFFGLVLGGAALSSAFLMSCWQRRSVVKTFLAGSGFLVLCSGIFPFVVYAVKLTGKPSPVAEVRGSFLRTLYRFVSHPAASVDRLAMVALMIGVVGLLLIALLPRRPEEPEISTNLRGLRLDLLAVPLALVIGIFVVFLAGKLIRSFDAYGPSYNLWVLPGLFIVVGSALARGVGRRTQQIACVAAGLAVIGSLWADSVMIASRPVFGHGLNDQLLAMMESGADGRLPIVVHERVGPWAFGYFPLRYSLDQKTVQYLFEPGSSLPPEQRRLAPLVGSEQAITLADLPPGRRVLVVSTSTFGQNELRQAVRGKIEIPSGDFIDLMDRSKNWSIVRSLAAPAMTAAQARLYQRR